VSTTSRMLKKGVKEKSLEPGKSNPRVALADAQMGIRRGEYRQRGQRKTSRAGEETRRTFWSQEVQEALSRKKTPGEV